MITCSSQGMTGRRPHLAGTFSGSGNGSPAFARSPSAPRDARAACTMKSRRFGWSDAGNSVIATAGLSILGEGGWQTAGAMASVLVLGFVVWEWVLYPLQRRIRLRRPCRAHFVIRELERVPLPYVVQDSDMHQVRELVLPANSCVDIEIGYFPSIHFHEVAFIFACEGKEGDRPFAKERFTRFVKVGKSRWVPGTDATDTVDVHNYYHVSRDAPRNIGTHFVTGFRLQTLGAGIYSVTLTFLTDEVEGVSKRLTIRVEDKPKTRMRCYMRGHLGCFVRPRIPPKGESE